MEDLFVNKCERGGGLGKYLVNYASHYMKSIHVNEMTVEANSIEEY